MGLGFWIDGKWMAGVSYSGFSSFKRQILDAAIQYCDTQIKPPCSSTRCEESSLEKDNSSEEDNSSSSEDNSSEEEGLSEETLTNELWESLQHKLKKLTVANKSRINYDHIDELNEENLGYFNLIGLKWFVDHSDCDGYWSPGQCLDILIMFDMLDEEDLTPPFVNNTWRCLFLDAVTKRKPILFC